MKLERLVRGRGRLPRISGRRLWIERSAAGFCQTLDAVGEREKKMVRRDLERVLLFAGFEGSPAAGRYDAELLFGGDAQVFVPSVFA